MLSPSMVISVSLDLSILEKEDRASHSFDKMLVPLLEFLLIFRVNCQSFIQVIIISRKHLAIILYSIYFSNKIL
jgi:hypothetical protein